MITEKKVELFIADLPYSIKVSEKNDISLDEYTKEVQRMFESGKINILSTIKSRLLIRPSKILAVEITEQATDRIVERKI